MKALMLIPPAQAEALLDAREEPWNQRFPSRPWMDDDGPEETTPSAKSPPADRDENDSRRQPQRRAA